MQNEDPAEAEAGEAARCLLSYVVRSMEGTDGLQVRQHELSGGRASENLTWEEMDSCGVQTCQD